MEGGRKEGRKERKKEGRKAGREERDDYLPKSFKKHVNKPIVVIIEIHNLRRENEKYFFMSRSEK